MSRFIARRLIAAVPTLIGVSLIVFLMVHLAPGDPARLIGGPDASADDLVAIRRSLRLDEPLPVQYWTFITSAATGDFGRSFRTRGPVAAEIAARYPLTFELAVVAMLIALVIGLAAGIVSATRQNTVVDSAVTVASIIGVSLPSFLLGIVLLLGLSLTLPIFPASGTGGPLWTIDGLAHIALPALTLGVAAAASIARLTRSSMLEVLRDDYVRTARAKGLREFVVLRRHALKNALVPIFTLASIQFGYLLGGAIIVESVFGWPGIGRLIVTGISSRDYPVIQGSVLVLAVTFVVLNLVVDILYSYLDPRVRYA